MRLTVIRLLVFLFSCLALWFTVRRYRENAVGFRSTAIWFVLLGAIALTSLFPDLLELLTPLTGMRNRMFFVLLVGILVLYALLFNITSRLERMERNLRRLTQQRALDRLLVGREDPSGGSDPSGHGKRP